MSQQMPAPKRILALDLTKGIAIVMVILKHVHHLENAQSPLLYIATVIPAVPLFLICSGYALSLSQGQHQGSIASWFSPRRFSKCIKRIIVPWLIAVGVTVAALFLVEHVKRIRFETIVKMLVMGGRGPGAYYILISLQLLVVFPFIFAAFKRHPIITTVAVVALQCVYEYCFSFLHNPTLYHYLIPRFFSQIVAGCLLYRYEKKLRHSFLPALLLFLSIVLLTQDHHLHLKRFLLFPNVMLLAAYAFGALYCLLRTEDFLQKYQRLTQPVRYLGRASLHIMLAQMVYFYFARKHGFEARFSSQPVVILVDLAITLPAGCLFFEAETLLRKLLPRRHRVDTTAGSLSG